MCSSPVNLLLYILFHADLPMRDIKSLKYAPHQNEIKKITLQIIGSVNLE